jgi:hypothetical protein
MNSSASDAVKGAVGEAASESVEAATVAAGQVAQDAKSAAERAGLTPAAAADAARSIGGKVKRAWGISATRADGEGQGQIVAIHARLAPSQGDLARVRVTPR